MDLNFIKPEEIVTLLGERLRKQRLFLEMSQAEVAARSGVGVNTVSNLEAGRNVSVENLVRIAMVLGRLHELQELFQPQLNSVNDILRYESQSKRHRIKRKGSCSLDLMFITTVGVNLGCGEL